MRSYPKFKMARPYVHQRDGVVYRTVRCVQIEHNQCLSIYRDYTTNENMIRLLLVFDSGAVKKGTYNINYVRFVYRRHHIAAVDV